MGFIDRYGSSWLLLWNTLKKTKPLMNFVELAVNFFGFHVAAFNFSHGFNKSVFVNIS